MILHIWKLLERFRAQCARKLLVLSPSDRVLDRKGAPQFVFPDFSWISMPAFCWSCNHWLMLNAIVFYRRGIHCFLRLNWIVYLGSKCAWKTEKILTCLQELGIIKGSKYAICSLCWPWLLKTLVNNQTIRGRHLPDFVLNINAFLNLSLKFWCFRLNDIVINWLKVFSFMWGIDAISHDRLQRGILCRCCTTVSDHLDWHLRKQLDSVVQRLSHCVEYGYQLY